MVKEQYWNINGYGYTGVDSKDALGKYADDFIKKPKIQEQLPIVLVRVSKKEFDGYTRG